MFLETTFQCAATFNLGTEISLSVAISRFQLSLHTIINYIGGLYCSVWETGSQGWVASIALWLDLYQTSDDRLLTATSSYRCALFPKFGFVFLLLHEAVPVTHVGCALEEGNKQATKRGGVAPFAVPDAPLRPKSDGMA